jgi:hypothetical protein
MHTTIVTGIVSSGVYMTLSGDKPALAAARCCGLWEPVLDALSVILFCSL